ncbi:type II secretion system inner membrane protein GspF [Kordiimonas pumila]|uniref:General secretion pathway protein F n=1 Tax=Kordiimonas pumila TaxID=2161677 RepID=A0ABV7D6E3_9PROT|nr:type II secretion system inner membrane protein GspF [Kordiimonas pumila]
MQAFDYKALDSRGKQKTGVIAAESEREARRRLKDGNLYVTALAQSGRDKKSGFSFAAMTDKISSRDVALVTRQLATLLEAGAPVEEAVSTIAGQSEKPAVRRVLMRVRTRVMEGMRLSQALEQEPATFDSLYRSMVAAGEASGDIGRILSRIADHREKSEEISAKIQTALLYPAVLSVVAFGVICAMMVFVVPKVVTQFEGYGHALPLLTQIVVAVSGFMVDYGIVLLLVAVSGVAGFIALMRRPDFKYRIHSVLLALPLIGRLIRTVNTARFARSVGTLVDGGSPLLEAMTASKATVMNAPMHKALESIIAEVREGVAASAAIRQSGMFIPMLSYMMAAGEKSGRIADMLSRVADYLDREFDDFSKKALSLLEPMIVVLMGVVVGTIVMSIMLPILQLNSLILK